MCATFRIFSTFAFILLLQNYIALRDAPTSHKNFHYNEEEKKFNQQTFKNINRSTRTFFSFERKKSTSACDVILWMCVTYFSYIDSYHFFLLQHAFYLLCLIKLNLDYYYDELRKKNLFCRTTFLSITDKNLEHLSRMSLHLLKLHIGA